MLNVGHIKEIWRYPVKGMAGESLASVDLGERGVGGDRTWALRDVARKEIQSCKFRPQLLQCMARDRSNGAGRHVEVIFPDGAVVESTDASIHDRLSQLIGRASTLEALKPASDLDFYRRHKLDDHTWFDELKATFEREEGEPLPDFSQAPPAFAEYVGTPGMFFLVTPLHVVTTATLRHLKSLNPRADWDRRRFRPNLLIEPSPDASGLVEQDWIGKHLELGDATIDCIDTTPRCGAITRAQPDFAFDTTMLRTFVGLPARESWPFLAVSIPVNCLYFFFLVNAYRVGDLSLAYPVARGLAPLFVLILSALFVHEVPSLTGSVGVVLISAAIFALAARRGATREHWATLWWAGGVGLTIALYTIIDGLGGRASGNVVGYVAVLNVATGIAVCGVAVARRGHAVVPALRESWKNGLVGGVLMLFGYMIVVYALTLAPMAQISALRECSVIFAAILGVIFLREPLGGRRIVASVAVAIGIAILAFGR